jgi:D-alanyl-D-alanine carboxypeptidase
MTGRMGQSVRTGLFLMIIMLAGALAPLSALAAPYAAMVMDARNGEVIHAHNADTRLHPASLTKMMTLYIAFQAIQRGEITLDTEVTVTREAANEPPSKLGLRAGQKIRMRYLLRAAAVKSANDASTAIGIGISGSQAAFAARMNATAKAMGMNNTTFRNMHGLTQDGHLSTARDMSVLGRHMIYDFPQYYNLFSRRTADAGIAQVAHTNSRFLDSYRGADGIKTGYTRAAGFNLVASAERGEERIITTVFGGASTAARNAKVAELMDLGFARAPDRVAVRRPQPPGYHPGSATSAAPVAVAMASAASTQPGSAGKTIRVSGVVARSLRPQLRPGAAPAPELALVSADLVASVVASVAAATPPAAPPAAAAVAAASLAAVAPAIAAPPTTIAEAAAAPEPAPEAAVELAVAGTLAPRNYSITPRARPAEMAAAAASVAPSTDLTAVVAQENSTSAEPEVVTRISTSGGHHWGINVGRFNSRNEAERTLLQVALNEMSALDGSLRRVSQGNGGFDANFMGLTREGADLACRRLQARGTTCFMIGPAS